MGQFYLLFNLFILFIIYFIKEEKWTNSEFLTTEENKKTWIVMLKGKKSIRKCPREINCWEPKKDAKFLLDVRCQ